LSEPAADLPELVEGERYRAALRPARAAFIRAHAVMAGIGAVAAGGVLVAMGDANWWVGPVAAVGALGVRGVWLMSEAMGFVWHLTDRRLIGPGGRIVALADLERVRILLGDVQIVTRGGDKHLIRYLADAGAGMAEIEAARARKARRR